MELCDLGEACNRFCAMEDDRARSRDPLGVWLNGYRHDGIYDLALYTTRRDDGYMSHGSKGRINWIVEESVYCGYPSESPGGARNHRYEIPREAYLPNLDDRAD